MDFIIYDLRREKKLKKFNDREIKEKDIQSLSKAKEQAYQILIKYGVKPPIALYTIIPTIKGGLIDGFEDHFVRFAIEHFNAKAKQKDAGILVNWWTKRKTFDVKEGGEEWSKINEKIIALRKKMQQNNLSIYENRIIAKDMTKSEFETSFKAKERVKP